MDLPLLRNIYSVLFAKYESELLTLGLTRQGLLGREPQAPSLLPSALPEIHLARDFGLEP